VTVRISDGCDDRTKGIVFSSIAFQGYTPWGILTFRLTPESVPALMLETLTV
jgi:hypothetical protein